MGGGHKERKKCKGFGRSILKDLYDVDTQECVAMIGFREVTTSEKNIVRAEVEVRM